MRNTDTLGQWWRSKTRADFDRPRNGVAPPDTFATSATRPAERIRNAEAQVRAWVTDLRGGFDAGSGARFDERLDGLEIEWHAQDERRHGGYLSELDLRIAAVRRCVSNASDTVSGAENNQRRAERAYNTARQRLGGDSEAEPATNGKLGGPYYQAPELLHGPSRDVLMWLFVLGAVIGDLAAFYVVLARLFGAQPAIILAGTIGFAAAAIGICHHVGVGLRQRRAADKCRSDGLLWAERAGWLALGCAAFVARLRYGGPLPGSSGSSTFGLALSGGGTDQDLIAALTFAGLYVVSGLVAMTTSFYTFNPAARAFRRASRTLQETTRHVEIARGRHVEQLGHLKAVESERSRTVELRAAVHRRTRADVVSLKILVRHRMAAELQDPRALDLLMKDAPQVDPYPEPGGLP